MGGLWAVLAWFYTQGSVAYLAVALACTTVVPLGLALAAPSLGRFPLALRAAALLAPFDAAASVTGFTWPAGHSIAIAAAALHLLLCTCAALWGLKRLFARGLSSTIAKPDELAFDVGLFLLPIGGIWLLASRAHVSLAGFEEPIVFFTAAHFHFAGFAAPTVLGALGRFLRDEGASPLTLRYRIAVAIVCAGVPLTAIGIATTHTVEVLAAIGLAAGMLVAGGLLIGGARRAWRRSTTAAKIAGAILALAGSALALTMALAATFATTSSAGRGSSLAGVVPVQTMIDLHGGMNSIVFALGALVGLTALDRSSYL